MRILLLLLLFAMNAYALPISPIIPSGTTLPATCRTGSLFIDLDQDTDGALYQCVATNSWKIVGSGAGGGVDTSGTPVAYDIARFTDVDTIEGLSYSELKTAMDLEAGTDFYSVSGADAAFQPLESTLTDIADGIIGENLVNIAYPWADNEVADDISLEFLKMNVHTSAPDISDVKAGDEIWVDSVTYDPTGQGLNANLQVMLSRNSTELFDDSENQDFTVGNGQWADNGLASFGKTTDLTITANDIGDYASLAGVEAPTTSAAWYRLKFDVDNLVGSWTLLDADGTNTLGTISAEGTNQTIYFIADDSTGGFQIKAVTATASADFDNFSLNLVNWKAVKDELGNVYFKSIRAAMGVITDTSGGRAIAASEMNGIVYMTDTGDADIPDGQCDAAADVGNWVTIMTDADDTVSLTSLDASNHFINDDLTDFGAGDELDIDGNSVTVMCIAAEYWKVTGWTGAQPTDGGVAD